MDINPRYKGKTKLNVFYEKQYNEINTNVDDGLVRDEENQIKMRKFKSREVRDG